MIQAFNAAADQTQNFDNLLDMIWNVLTAIGYGLEVWGRIVGVGRALSFPGSVSYLGFEEAGSSWTGFGQGILFSGGGTTTNFLLSDSDFRRLILAKAAANITDGSIRSFNAILLALFPQRGLCLFGRQPEYDGDGDIRFCVESDRACDRAANQRFALPVGVVINVVQP